MRDSIKMEIAISRLQEAIAESQEFVLNANEKSQGSSAADYAVLAGALEGWIEVLGSRMQGVVAILNMEAEK